jgi:hypothetical protein
MPYLVKPITDERVDTCYQVLKEAHDYLARHGAAGIGEVQRNTEPMAWGSSMKRLRVSLPEHDRPALVDVSEHNMIEIINQCATMERLLDALAWACQPGSGLSESMVARCHPTTSSTPSNAEQETPDNDLVLVGQDGSIARFEVSDVTGRQDSNRKEERDLISLGVLHRGRGMGDERFVASWPAARLFLVVSQEFSHVLLKPGKRWYRRCFVYHSVFCNGHTNILEMLPTKEHGLP